MNRTVLISALFLSLLFANFEVASSVFVGIIPTIAFIALIAVLFKIKEEKKQMQSYGGGYGGYSSGGGGGYGSGGGGGGYGGSMGYYKRSIDDDSPELPLPQNITLKQLEKAFDTIYKYDEKLCVPRLICEIHATPERSAYGDLEKGILKIFDVYHPKKRGSPGAIYRQAADFGSRSFSDAACWSLYSGCDMTPPELTNLVRFLD